MDTIFTFKRGTPIIIYYRNGLILQGEFMQNMSTYVHVKVDGQLITIDKHRLKDIDRRT